MKKRGWIALGVTAGALGLAGMGGIHVFKGMLWDAMMPRVLPTPAVPTGLRSLSSAECGSCHTAIYAEWQASRMGQAMHNAAFLADWRGADEMPYCLNCHAALQAQQPAIVTGVAQIDPMTFVSTPNPTFDASLQAEGVTCVACHVVEGQVLGVHPDTNAPHPVLVDTRLTDGSACAHCHETALSPLFEIPRPLIDTMAEWRTWKEKTGRTETCVECHMAPVERANVEGGPIRQGRAHTFPGGWDDATLAQAVTLANLRREGGEWAVDVANVTGHRFPTGEGSPMIEVRFTALDAAGAPTSNTAAARFGRVVEGPPFKDLEDTTLREAETRTFRVALPQPAEHVRVEVIYRRFVNTPALHELASGSPLDVVVATLPGVGA